MKIYFTASETGGLEKHLFQYKKILHIINKLGHKNTNPFYAQHAPLKKVNKHKVSEKDDIFNLSRKNILDSFCVIAEITAPSVTLGIQIEFAISKKIPVLCLLMEYEKDQLPLMLRDYKNSLITKRVYNEKNLEEIITKFLQDLPKGRIKFNLFIDHDIHHYLSFKSRQLKKPKSEIVRRTILKALKIDKTYRKNLSKSKK